MIVLLLNGCTSTGSSGVAGHDDDDRLVEAATTPIRDLNLVQVEIPPILLAANKAPYALPTDTACAALIAELDALNAVLGADVDEKKEKRERDAVLAGAEDAVVGTVRSAADVIPFRGWVRNLTGAERASQKVSAAIRAGTLRRAYLKGFSQAQGCSLPLAHK